MPEEITAWFPSDFLQWPAFYQAGLIALLTFVSEDLACISAALLIGIGSLPWWVGWSGAFLGIWAGDASLYGFARIVGDRIRQWKVAQRWLDSPKVRESEAWFEKRGLVILWICRLIPGTRLPTYLAAGFVHLPFLSFLVITGIAALLWTVVIFLAVSMVGLAISDWLKRFEHGVLGFLVVASLLFVGIQWLQRMDCWRLLTANRAALDRWTRWEFWPPWLFYCPVALDCLWLGIKYRGFSLPTVANPGIETGGMIGESKFDLLKDLQRVAPEYTAEAFPIAGRSHQERVTAFEHLMKEHSLTYPVIIKPDIGQRGSGVRKVGDIADAQDCLQPDGFVQIVQRYAFGPHEAGVFYCRYPNEAKGSVFAITHKIFPKLVGDGRQTLRELIGRDERARIMASVYCRRFENQLDRVLLSGETFRLVEAGNHAQGCIFKDGMFLHSPCLEARIDEISQRLDGFFVGRYDIRYESESLLRSGEGFQIVELNGAASEATSIYDPDNSLRSAYQTLHRQWDMVFAIGAANRRRGVRPLSLWRLFGIWRRYQAQAKEHLLAD
ncbi:MAG: hypothetical protein M2R45_03502 [Verrucomicrobia subdivision 3 bacterium]|nr:hypothetical protein [Limisphaerales bacterium]MCS1415898.1 hypothetical protein [Limisphaerales bacterium]